MKRDKILHGLTGYFIASSTFHIWENYWLSFLVTVGLGIGYEAYQHIAKKGLADIKDALATVGGSLIYFALIRWF